MSTDPREDLFIASIPEKETYSDEEKKFILKKLNDKRVRRQRSEEASSNVTKEYSQAELDHLNRERQWLQKREEMQKKRLYNKKIYNFGNKEYYKFVNMEREYYIAKEKCGKFYARPSIVTLYYRVFSEMKKKDVLLKIEPHSEKIFISYNVIRVYFKPYTFEENR